MGRGFESDWNVLGSGTAGDFKDGADCVGSTRVERNAEMRVGEEVVVGRD